MSCYPSKIETYHSLFHEFHDVFSWSYEEMLGLDTSIVEQTIKIYPDVRMVCQHLHLVHNPEDGNDDGDLPMVLLLASWIP